MNSRILTSYIKATVKPSLALRSNLTLILSSKCLYSSISFNKVKRLNNIHFFINHYRFYSNQQNPSNEKGEPITSKPKEETTNASSTSALHAVLAEREQEANQHFNDPNIQAGFYRLLMNSGYPQYVVSRFETPGIASSPECTTIYIKALEETGKHVQAESVKQTLAANNGAGTNTGNTTSTASPSAPYVMNTHIGTPKEPVHVIITESTATIVSRWIRWLVIFGLLTYGVSEGFKYITENTSLLKSSEVADKSVDVTKTTVKFDDVRGCDEARAELEEIVDFLKDPAKYEALGGKLPKGVLLTGPPGTGKTLLARATAGEAGVDFFFMSGSEFDEVYVGVGAKRIRELFSQARARSPAIIFIDELDAIGGKRNPKDQAYAKQTLNQLLVELDGFSQTSGIIIIGATNFPESLDKALTRPGRFDKVVNVDLPDVRGRADILRHHMKKVTLAPDVDPEILARGTPGLSGAELMNLVNQAAVYACQKNAIAVDMNHFEWAKDKILMGAERKTMVLTEATRKATAYHEAGHAIMALYTPGATSLYKATILPRGRALGITFQLPEMDKVDITKKECKARLDVCMGGKIAEELIYGKEHTTSGCGSDLQGATGMARAMVTQYGMSERVGPVNLSDKWETWSGKIRDVADQEVVDLLKDSEERSRKLLEEKNDELHRLAQGLMEYETLDRAEIERVCRGEPLNRIKYSTNKVIDGPDNDERKNIDKSLPAPI
ncbi:probable Mitochondrial inner membrane i-AAA protease supercomplex subunit YME1 [Saccharomycodes ludwigii]|uniref:Probable Mitochondrial inner membrane i-AAA protease supercomplex subunit YME1 n=1 Tax=Saccharomycodes ludwigii TaxID=36035 RepID=A0A376B218_9ASCO|nr:hypothetical protein SCDLUD_000135 [Saccharomycodes ludwigii]KAH3902555.1 hypothetical protein SCDLUD_000135 [Saccharomycodes ludwigii]SSD58736.1 probable Mitochondrial inner membrane i-AAA protease supercomplex subunit YME1 [Saccharomycodes ludwigii]